MIDNTYRELTEPAKPKQRSRIWSSSNGYIFLVPWSNANLLRILVRRFTDSLPRKEFRLKAQFDDTARSTVANIEEGFARPTTTEYLNFLGFSQASLKEVKGDTQRSCQDGLLRSVAKSSLGKIGIDLMDWHEKLKASVISRPVATGSYGKLRDLKGNYRKLDKLQTPLSPFKFLYPPVDDLKAQDLTYEIFIELINKTDWNLRKLVESLETKLAQDKKRKSL